MERGERKTPRRTFRTLVDPWNDIFRKWPERQGGGWRRQWHLLADQARFGQSRAVHGKRRHRLLGGIQPRQERRCVGQTRRLHPAMEHRFKQRGSTWRSARRLDRKST